MHRQEWQDCRMARQYEGDVPAERLTRPSRAVDAVYGAVIGKLQQRLPQSVLCTTVT
jgi:hypothetical protein